MLEKNKIILKINDLLAGNNNSYGKYCRNYSLYNQTPYCDLKSIHPSAVGYVDDVYSDDSIVPKLNVIKSCIDSVVSKMTTVHCRPYVNTVKGSFKTIQICKQLQIFFDYYFEEEELNDKCAEALRDACVFDTGYIYLNEKTGHIDVVRPWNVYTRKTEKDNFNSVYIEYPNYSVDLLSDEDYELLTKAQKNNLYTTLGYYYDCKNETKAILIDRKIVKIEEYKSVVPLAVIHYTNPVVGSNCVCITDMLKGIQTEIDEIMKRISDASLLNPANTIILSNASNVKVSKLTNKIGNIINYDNPQNTAPFLVNTPDFISSQYTTLLENLIEKAYNMVGISQLSAQGKKTPGLNSGVALATQSDIESDRFQNLLDQYIAIFTNVAKLTVKTFQKNKKIIEPNRYSLNFTWGEIEKEYNKMRIQFSAADSLSKDPSEKLKQLQALAQAGIIPTWMIASLLELPDINRGFSVANNAFNTVMTLIDGVIYDNKYDIPDYVPFSLLKEQIINMELSLRSASTNGSNDDDIKKLEKYYSKIEEREEELQGDLQEILTQGQQLDKINNFYGVYNKQNQNFDGGELNSGTEDNFTTQEQTEANPYSTSAANNGEVPDTQWLQGSMA